VRPALDADTVDGDEDVAGRHLTTPRDVGDVADRLTLFSFTERESESRRTLNDIDCHQHSSSSPDG
jgi:hypothetical protein